MATLTAPRRPPQPKRLADGSIELPEIKLNGFRWDTMDILELGDRLGTRRFRDAQFPRIEAQTQTPILGDMTGSLGFLGGLVNEGIPKLSGLLTDVLGGTINLASSSLGGLLDGFAGVVGQIPFIGQIAGALLLASKALVQGALQLGSDVLKAVGSLTAAWKTLDPKTQKALFQAAILLVVSHASPALQPQVKAKLENALPAVQEEVGTRVDIPGIVAGLSTVALVIGGILL